MCTGLEAVALSATASALAAGGAVYSGQQQKKMANYQAAQAEADADASKAAARVEAERIRKAGREQAAAANAAMAASGVETGEGTALRITSGVTEDAEQDAYQTILNGVNSSSRLQAQAQAARFSGSNASTAGYIDAGSSLLAGGAKAYNGWVKWKDGQK